MRVAKPSDVFMHLRRDSVLKSLIDQFGLLKFHSHQEDLFSEIVDSIISQQLSGKVAKIIYARFENLFPEKKVDPKIILALDDITLRNVGMSWAKVKYVKDLAQKTIDGVIKLPTLSSLSDEEVIAHLIQVKGIGPWTAEMILMFSLHRPDILPLDDLGIQVAFEKLYRVKRGNKERMLQIGETWRPYRTFACRYLWKSLDNE